MSEKKDLTRIEDLSEYLHELEEQAESDLEEGKNPLLDSTEAEEFEDLPSPPQFDDESEQEQEESSFDFNQDESSFELDEMPEQEQDLDFQEEAPIEVTEEAVLEEQKEEPPPKRKSTPETFDDVKSFAGHMSYGKITMGGNPPFSLIIKNLKYEEDAEDILILLREHSIVNGSNEKEMRRGLEQGALLLSQLSEYTAIYLAHRLRRFHCDIQMGLSDELHPSKYYEREGKGLVSKQGLFQNKNESITLPARNEDNQDIILATTPFLEDYQISRYIDIVTDHKIVYDQDLNEKDFQSSFYQDDESEVEIGPGVYYKELSNALKGQAIKLKANAVVGISFTLTPLTHDNEGAYKLTCSGNAVWVQRTKGK